MPHIETIGSITPTGTPTPSVSALRAVSAIVSGLREFPVRSAAASMTAQTNAALDESPDPMGMLLSTTRFIPARRPSSFRASLIADSAWGNPPGGLAEIAEGEALSS
ncbi:MAG TPA: hypothetical protein VF115_10925 [Acidimicrobiia bacterium]